MELSRQQMRNRVDELMEELADVEQQQEDKTLPHSDQQLLDQAWEDLTDQIAYLQEIIEMGEEAFEEEPADEFDPSIQSRTVYHMGGNVYVDQEELDRLNSMEDKRTTADYYETDFGVYYDAVDEI